MRILKLISTCFLAALMLFSSLGISFYLHDCNCRHAFYVNIGLGFSEPEPEVCCSSCASKTEKKNHGVSIDRKGCCHDYVYYYVLPVTKDNVVAQITNLIPTNLSKAVTEISDQYHFSLAGKTNTCFHSPPPLKPGKDVIYLFQQIKIPFPTC